MSAVEMAKQPREVISMSHVNSTMDEVDIKLYAPDAKKVSIAGQFNNWNTASNPMKKAKDGSWRIKMRLPLGRTEYKYFADGAWVQDVSGAEKVPNPFGTTNLVMNVQ